jgi:hypothetical protein
MFHIHPIVVFIFWLGKVCERNIMLQYLFTLSLVALVLVSGQQFQPHPQILAQNHIDYTKISAEDILHSAPGQTFPNLHNATLSNAIELIVPADPIYDLRGFEFDFVVGRRLINTTTPFNFSWEISSLKIPWWARLRVFDNCEATTLQPCTLMKEFSVAHDTIPISIYNYMTLAWGHVYRASIILPTGSNGRSLLLTAPVTENVAVYWIAFDLLLDSQDPNTGYEYIARLPVTSQPNSNLLLYDSLDMLDYHMTNWTPAGFVSTRYFGGITSPMVGYRIAAYASISDNETTEPIPISPGVIPPTFIFPLAPTVFDAPTNESLTEPHTSPSNNGIIMIVGFVIVSALFFICAVAVVLVIYRRMKRSRHAYNSLNDGNSESPLDDYYGNAGDPSHAFPSNADYGSGKGNATRPLKLVGSHSGEERVEQFDASGLKTVQSPRSERRNNLSSLLSEDEDGTHS